MAQAQSAYGPFPGQLLWNGITHTTKHIRRSCGLVDTNSILLEQNLLPLPFRLCRLCPETGSKCLTMRCYALLAFMQRLFSLSASFHVQYIAHLLEILKAGWTQRHNSELKGWVSLGLESVWLNFGKDCVLVRQSRLSLHSTNQDGHRFRFR